mgnify:CR=1 FL=1
MIISTKCQYALRAVFELARAEPGHVLTINGIADSQRVPQRYLETILNQLRKGGILQAVRGRSGGYKLAMPPGQVTIADIVKAVDGSMRVAPPQEKDSANPATDNTVFSETWQRLHIAMDKVLDSVSFAELIRMEKERKSKANPNYVI